MHHTLDVWTLLGPLGRIVRETMAAGARMIERQDGYTPARLCLGGLVVWALCLAAMLLGAHALSLASLVRHYLAAHPVV